MLCRAGGVVGYRATAPGRLRRDRRPLHRSPIVARSHAPSVVVMATVFRRRLRSRAPLTRVTLFFPRSGVGDGALYRSIVVVELAVAVAVTRCRSYIATVRTALNVDRPAVDDIRGC